MKNHAIILLAGPTASGKSALALALAARTQAVIINADSQQAYAGLPILAASPTPEDMAQAPHRLYGHVPPEQVYSAGLWLADAVAEIRAAWGMERLPVVVGGTGLFFRALERGLAEMPAVDPAVREEGNRLLAALGREKLAERLVAEDPALAEALDLANPARLLRAFEVRRQTGRSILAWQRDTTPPLPEACLHAFALTPPVEWLNARIDRRVGAMVEAGVLEEAKAFLQHGLPATLPAMQTLGLPEFAGYFAGEYPLEDALNATRQTTRQYAKRQRTWFRQQCKHWRVLDPASRLIEGLATEILDALL